MADGTFCDPDNWHGVYDPQKRKQIQNRLAQRARRKRLAKRNSIQKIIRPQDGSLILSEHVIGLSDRSQALVSASAGVCQQRLPSPSPESQLGRSPFASLAWAVVVPPTKDPSSGVSFEFPPAVFGALFNNGALIGLTCANSIPSKSTPQPASVPSSLHPTALQLTTIHPRWIDRFPFPRMRDNLITLSSIIEEEEFAKDIFSMESFSIKPWTASWDPTGWIMGREFSKKWGYLFY